MHERHEANTTARSKGQPKAQAPLYRTSVLDLTQPDPNLTDSSLTGPLLYGQNLDDPIRHARAYSSVRSIVSPASSRLTPSAIAISVTTMCRASSKTRRSVAERARSISRRCNVPVNCAI